MGSRFLIISAFAWLALTLAPSFAAGDNSSCESLGFFIADDLTGSFPSLNFVGGAEAEDLTRVAEQAPAFHFAMPSDSGVAAEAPANPLSKAASTAHFDSQATPEHIPQAANFPSNALAKAPSSDGSGMRAWEPPPPAPSLDPLKRLGYQFPAERFAHGGEAYASHAIEPGPNGKHVIIKEAFREPERLVEEASHLKRMNQREDEIVNRERARGSNRGDWLPYEIRSRHLFVRGKLKKIEGHEPVLVMDFIPDFPGSHRPAPTLADRLKDPNDRVLKDPAKRLRIMQQLIEANRRMHEAGLIHRDLKPANMLIDNEGWLTIIDFGFSEMDGRRWYGWKDDFSARQEGYMVPMTSGTPEFMSPDQRRGLPGKEDDDLYATHKILMFVAAHGNDVSPYLFRRPFGLLGKSLAWINDFKYAPEFPGVDPRLAAVLWSPHLTKDKTFEEVVRKLTTLPPEQFDKWYAEKLVGGQNLKEDPQNKVYPRADDAALTIAGSKFLIDQFPNHYTREQQDAIIRSVLHYYYLTKNQRVNHPGEDELVVASRRRVEDGGRFALLHYEDFLKKVEALHQEGRALSVTEYLAQMP